MDADGSADGSGRGLQSEKVYARLRRDITGQRLPQGTVLLEASLSEDYGASRTPVREALFRLHQEGFVERVGRRLFVKDFSFAEVQELYQMREALEKMAVRLCIERATDAELDRVAEQFPLYETFDIETEYEAFNEHANLFHRSIAALCGNAMIHRALDAIHDKVLAINARYWRQGNKVEDARSGHAGILQAIRDRDVLVAEAAVRVHIQTVVTLYRQGSGGA